MSRSSISSKYVGRARGASFPSRSAGIGVSLLSRLVAYRISPERSLDLVPSPAKRAWMDASYRGFANRCLPLLIANQAGWFILNGHEFRATWSGGRTRAAVRIEYLENGAPCECAWPGRP